MVLGIVGVATIAIVAYALHSLGEAQGEHPFTDTVRQRATSVCGDLFKLTDGIAADVSDEPIDRVTAENHALQQLISDFGDLGIQAIEADKPALTWLNDWRRLIAARGQYTAALLDDPLALRPAMPLTPDGFPISRPLSSFVIGCSVPLTILDDFDISPFLGEECTYTFSVGICATPDGGGFIDGLIPDTEASVWIRFGDAVSQSTRVADSDGRIKLTGVRLGNGTVVIVDAIVNDLREVAMAA